MLFSSWSPATFPESCYSHNNTLVPNQQQHRVLIHCSGCCNIIAASAVRPVQLTGDRWIYSSTLLYRSWAWINWLIKQSINIDSKCSKRTATVTLGKFSKYSHISVLSIAQIVKVPGIFWIFKFVCRPLWVCWLFL